MTGKFAATLAYKAFIAARKELVNVADSDATGFRSHDVPVVYFVLSDVSLCTCVCLYAPACCAGADIFSLVTLECTAVHGCVEVQ